LDEDKLSHTKVIAKNNHITITCTSSHRRHCVRLKWDDYCKISTKKETIARERVGAVTGNMLAKNLVISFQAPHIKEF